MYKFRAHGFQIMRLSIGFFIAASLLLWGWNSSMPEVFGLPPILFKQSAGLLILLYIVTFSLNMRSKSWSRGVSKYCLNSVNEERQ